VFRCAKRPRGGTESARERQAATEQRVGYAGPMSSPSNPHTLLPAGRTKWLWLAIAGALGLWLLMLLMLSGPKQAEVEKAKTPFDAVGAKAKGFDTLAAEAFSGSQRLRVKSSKRSAPFPVAPDQRKSE
jgi:hypothetical protein